MGIVKNHNQLYSDDLALTSQNLVEYKLKLIQNEINHVCRDLLYLSKDNALREYITSSGSNRNFQKISTVLLNFINNKNQYGQISLADTSGQEVFRVKYRRGKTTIAQQENLKNIFHKIYFNKTLQLKPGEIYASELRLNTENNQVEVPINPVIHFSTPVYDNTGNQAGIIILSFLSKQLLDNFNQNNENQQIELLLLNHDGYYLSGLRPEDERSFMFKKDVQHQFSQDFPLEWTHIQSSNRGIINNENGLIAYSTISNFEIFYLIRDCEISDLRAIAYISPDSLKQLQYKATKKLIPTFVIFILFAALALWHLVRHSMLRNKNEKQLALLNKFVSNERDLFINGPTIVFNWRDQYGWPVDYVSDNIKSVLGYSPARFLGNELSYSSIVAPEFHSQIVDDLTAARQKKLKAFELRPYQVIDANGKRVWLQHFSTAIQVDQNNITHYYGYVNDITHIKKTEEDLKESRKYVNNLLEILPDPTVVIDVNNYKILHANASAKALYNEGATIPAHITCYQLSHHQNTPCDGKDDPCPIQQIMQQKKCASVVHRHFINGGNEVFVELVSRPIFNEEGEIIQIIESQRDITHHINNERRLTEQATTDPLTETYNRLKFDNELELQLEIAQTSATQFGLIMFDLDNFKQINDNFGHDAGDQVLKDIAHLARESIRKTDFLARWGGEEFMILLPNTQLSAVKKIAENLREKIDQYCFKKPQHITSSFGVTTSDGMDSCNELIKRVDNALYQSKNEGKNRVTTWLK
jgi:diguanylate cyclase (GGDEF)-like protein/PAS domain S-box-containing protein